eukprot:gene17190-biopygen26095
MLVPCSVATAKCSFLFLSPVRLFPYTTRISPPMTSPLVTGHHMGPQDGPDEEPTQLTTTRPKLAACKLGRNEFFDIAEHNTYGLISTRQFTSSVNAARAECFQSGVISPPDSDLVLRQDTKVVCPITAGVSPKFSRGLRLSHADLHEVSQQVYDLVAKGFIRLPRSAPLFDRVLGPSELSNLILRNDYELTTACSAFTTRVHGVLLQDERPIAFHSHNFSKAERTYSTGEQEFTRLSNLTRLKSGDAFEGCRQFELDTDHEPLVYLANQPMLSRTQARYMEFFSRFSNMKWNHIARRSSVTDSLSRKPDFSHAAAMLLQRLDPDDPLHARDLMTDILAAYESDDWFDDPRNVQYLTHRPDGFWIGTSHSKRSASSAQIVVPNNGNALKERILFAFHDTQRSGHPGFERTFQSIARYYWWPAMPIDVNDYVRSCDSCQRVKASHQKSHGLLQPLPIPICFTLHLTDCIILAPQPG